MSLFAQWKPQGSKIKTQWAAEVDPANTLPEYPRPIMRRTQWKNLNGLWDYAIIDSGNTNPSKMEGKILVPFPLESSLSGVQKQLKKSQELIYVKQFSIPKQWNGKKILLHFGAVDWRATVMLNDKKVGIHEGGYTPFTFDITPYLKKGPQTLTVKVWDPTNESDHPVGKQTIKPNGIWYTAVSGIWQTVWMEPVENQYISYINATPDIDSKQLHIKLTTENTSENDHYEVQIWDGARLVTSQKSNIAEVSQLSIKDQKLWSPEHPFLYDINVKLYHKDKIVDEIKSYAALRKISTKTDSNGIVRIQLNNENYFQYGPLDQGWWPDGLYTAPTDKALQYDIIKTKEWGFNLIRKHVKVEPARWYFHCDSIGMLVWQDMPSGGPSPTWQQGKYFDGKEIIRTSHQQNVYKREWQEIIHSLSPYPCVVVWVPFNEAWGQFNTKEISDWTKSADPSRLVNSASGGNYYHTGDILDIHHYPAPDMPLFDKQRVNVLGEYGGIGLALPEHLWLADKNWGYVQFKTSEEVTNEYCKYADYLKTYISKGFDAAIYTQTTDVEGEINGLMTYDRKIIKIGEEKVRKKNIEVRNSIPLQ